MSDFDMIRNTIARNNQYLDDRRYDDCSQTFTQDGSIAGHKGRAAILEFMLSQGLGARPDLQRRHVVANIAIEISGDEAQADSDLLMYNKVGAEPWKLSAVGRYVDRLARQPDGTWLFTERRLDFLELRRASRDPEGTMVTCTPSIVRIPSRPDTCCNPTIPGQVDGKKRDCPAFTPIPSQMIRPHLHPAGRKPAIAAPHPTGRCRMSRSGRLTSQSDRPRHPHLTADIACRRPPGYYRL